MCGMDEPRGQSFICGLMLAIYGIHFAKKLFYFTPTLLHRTPRENVPYGQLLGGTTLHPGGHQPVVGTLTEQLMTHSNGYITHPPLARYA